MHVNVFAAVTGPSKHVCLWWNPPWLDVLMQKRSSWVLTIAILRPSGSSLECARATSPLVFQWTQWLAAWKHPRKWRPWWLETWLVIKRKIFTAGNDETIFIFHISQFSQRFTIFSVFHFKFFCCELKLMEWCYVWQENCRIPAIFYSKFLQEIWL